MPWEYYKNTACIFIIFSAQSHLWKYDDFPIRKQWYKKGENTLRILYENNYFKYIESKPHGRGCFVIANKKLITYVVNKFLIAS